MPTWGSRQDLQDAKADDWLKGAQQSTEDFLRGFGWQGKQSEQQAPALDVRLPTADEFHASAPWRDLDPKPLPTSQSGGQTSAIPPANIPNSSANPPQPSAAASGVPAAMPTGAPPVVPSAPAAPVSGPSPQAASTPRGDPSGGVEQWNPLIQEAAQTYGVDPADIKGLMHIESGGRTHDAQGNPLRSSAGAIGLMQTMPFHYQPGENPDDPRTNIMRGAKIYAANLQRYGGDRNKAAAAYFGAIDANGNITGASDGNTDGYGYVRLFNDARARYQGAPNAGAVPPAAPAAPPAAPAAAASPPASAAAGAPAERHAPGAMVTVRDQWGNAFQMSEGDLQRRPGGASDLTVLGPAAMRKTLGVDIPETGLSVGDQKRQRLAAMQAGQPSDEPLPDTNVPGRGRIIYQDPDNPQPMPGTVTGLNDGQSDTGVSEATGTDQQTGRGLGETPYFSQDDMVYPVNTPGLQDRQGQPQVVPRAGAAWPAGAGTSYGAAPGTMYRQPLQATGGPDSSTGQDVGAADVPVAERYDPRDADQGAHELPRPNVDNIPPAESEQHSAGSPADDPGGAQFAAQDAYSAPAQPQAAQQSMPSINLPDLTPVYDAGGKLISYIKHGAEQAGQAVSDALAPVRQAASSVDQVDASPTLGAGQDLSDPLAPGAPLDGRYTVSSPVTRALNTPITAPERRPYAPYDPSLPPEENARRQHGGELAQDVSAIPYQAAEAVRSTIVDAATSFANAIRAGQEGRPLAAAGNALWAALQVEPHMAGFSVAQRTIDEMLPEARIAGVGPGALVGLELLIGDGIKGVNALRNAPGRLLSPDNMARADEAVSGAAGAVRSGVEAAGRGIRGALDAAPERVPAPGEMQVGSGVVPRETGASAPIKIPPARVRSYSAEIATSHAENGGSTINPSQGDMVGKPLYSVSLYPEQGIVIKGRDVTPQDIETFLNEKNGARRKILEADPRISVGTWYDAKSDAHYIDLSATIGDRKLAENLGRAYNQKAIYDLKDLEEIATGGSGAIPTKALPPVDQRLPLVGQADQLARQGLVGQAHEIMAGAHPDWWNREFGHDPKAMAQANRLEAGLERTLQQTTDAEGLSTVTPADLKPYAQPTTKFADDIIPRPTPPQEIRAVVQAGLDRGYGDWYREFSDDLTKTVGPKRSWEAHSLFVSFSAVLDPETAKKLTLATMMAADKTNAFKGMDTGQIAKRVLGEYKQSTQLGVPLADRKGLYYMPVHFSNVESIYGVGRRDVGAPKLSNFFGDFFNGRLPWQNDAHPTNDVHMQRLEGYRAWGEEGGKLGNDENTYRYGSAMTRRVAGELGVPPEDAQAAGWVVQQLSSLPTNVNAFSKARRINLADPVTRPIWEAAEADWKQLGKGVRDGSVTPGEALAELQRIGAFDLHNPGSIDAINADPAIRGLAAAYKAGGHQDLPMPGSRPRGAGLADAPGIRGAMGHAPVADRPWMSADIRTRTQNPLNQRLLEQAPSVTVEGQSAGSGPFSRDLGVPNRLVDAGSDGTRGVALPTMNGPRATAVASHLADTLGQPVTVRRMPRQGETATHAQVTIDAANAPALPRVLSEVRQVAEDAGAEVHWNGQQAHIYIPLDDPAAAEKTLLDIYDGVQYQGINANALRMGASRVERIEPGSGGATAAVSASPGGQTAAPPHWRSTRDAELAQRLAGAFERDSGGAAPGVRARRVQPPAPAVGQEAAGSGAIPSISPGIRNAAYNAAQGGVVGAVGADQQAQQQGREATPGEVLGAGAVGAGLVVAAGNRGARQAVGRALGSVGRDLRGAGARVGEAPRANAERVGAESLPAGVRAAESAPTPPQVAATAPRAAAEATAATRPLLTTEAQAIVSHLAGRYPEIDNPDIVNAIAGQPLDTARRLLRGSWVGGASGGGSVQDFWNAVDEAMTVGAREARGRVMDPAIERAGYGQRQTGGHADLSQLAEPSDQRYSRDPLAGTRDAIPRTVDDTPRSGTISLGSGVVPSFGASPNYRPPTAAQLKAAEAQGARRGEMLNRPVTAPDTAVPRMVRAATAATDNRAGMRWAEDILSDAAGSPRMRENDPARPSTQSRVNSGSVANERIENGLAPAVQDAGAAGLQHELPQYLEDTHQKDILDAFYTRGKQKVLDERTAAIAASQAKGVAPPVIARMQAKAAADAEAAGVAAMRKREAGSMTYPQIEARLQAQEQRVTAAGKKSELDAAAQAVWDHNAETRQRLVDSGNLSQETADELAQTYPHYVPTVPISHLTEGGGPVASSSTAVSRGTKPSISALEDVGTSGERLNPIVASRNSTIKAEKDIQRNTVARAFAQMMDDAMHASPSAMATNTATHRTFMGGGADIHYFEDGVPKTLSVPKAVADGLEAASSMGMSSNGVTSFLKRVTGAVTSTLTAARASFVPVNVARDASDYATRTTVREGNNPAKLPAILGTWADEAGKAARDILASNATGRTAIGAATGFGAGALQGDDQTPLSTRLVHGAEGAAAGALLLGANKVQTTGKAAEYLARGGGSGAAVGSLKAGQRWYRDVLSSGGAPLKTPGEAMRYLGDWAHDVVSLQGVKGINERAETISRTAAMRRAESRGSGPVEAMLAGRDSSYDPDRAGTVTRAWNGFIPFLNATVQGGAQFGRMMKQNPVATTAAIGATLGPVMLATEYWNRSDPQRAQAYDDVPQYVKDSGIVLMMPGAGGSDTRGQKPNYLWLPTEVLTPFVVGMRAAMQHADAVVPGMQPSAGRSDANPNSVAPQALGALNEALSVFYPVRGDSAASIGSTFVPPIAKQAIELGQNKDLFRGGTISSPSQDERASGFAHTVAGAANSAGRALGNDLLQNVTPSHVDYLARQVPAYGDIITGASDMVKPSPYKQAEQDRLANEPFVGGVTSRFVRDAGGANLERAQGQAAGSPDLQAALQDARMRPSEVDVTVPSSVGDLPLNRDEQFEAQNRMNEYLSEELAKAQSSPKWSDPLQAQALVKTAISRAQTRATTEVIRTIPRDEQNDRKRQQMDAKALVGR